MTSVQAPPSTVLVVEDDGDSRDLIEQVLSDAGFVVVVAVDGCEALELLEKLVPALIITDLSMPRMDGLEFCTRLRARAPLRDVPVIFVSATEVFREKLRAFDVGASDFLAKPLDDVELVRRARNLVELSLTKARMNSLGQRR